jgi:DNA-binding NarL/FixJ family response regulator
MLTTNVFIADDHALVREGLRLLIEAEPDMKVVGEAADGQQAWKQTRELRPDVVVMDVSMPEMGGAQATERILAACPGVKVLAVSAHQDEAHVRLLLSSGASGYVLKKAASWELANAIRVVAKGGIHLDPSIAGQVVNNFVNPDTGTSGDVSLSAREIEVLMLVAWGHTNMEIADKLCLSVKTVEGHKTKIGEKLGLKTRASMVRYALRRGWLRDE